MSVETTNTLVIGAGQAGIAMSEHLGAMGIDHIVLERRRIAERWRSERWDSLVANGPAWHDRFPNLAFDDVGADVFPPKERMARYFEDYARMIQAPVRTGVEVLRVQRNRKRPGFTVSTSAGEIEARHVVAATGAFQIASYPAIVPAQSGIQQVHSSAYKNPGQLAEGAVLVVGAGASGSQIAEELRRAGRAVYLSVGEHYRPPRLSRTRLLLVAGRARHVGRGQEKAQARTCRLRGQRLRQWQDHRLPAPGPRRHPTGRHYPRLRRRRHDL